MTSTRTILTKKIALLSSSVALGALLLSGCSAASTDGATTEPMSVKDAIATMGTIEQAQIEYDGKFSSCLENRGAESADKGSMSADKRDAAQSACAEEVGDLPQPSEQQTVAMRTWAKALHSCLAEKGHKLPDLKADGQWDNGAMKTLQKTDTALNSDSEKCFTELSK
ncbi:hypothetical protein [Rathayibacter iranicus]|uniref:Lipoprotein n=2 Tax=Rathayibacter iranicus TaxID=59737 RepID=A0AAD1EN11_9MICO|nr:hypothetical protein [Rathayibacter iranicus]AZZ56668.1 hypothetical protein C7V51_12870 [Rathayibacter iranicus]MWV31296.1 hypothetical protein [Rathayibacter iranicus NCPPB 2253 = VKM Ac-1602]PPI43313.1 hypothetical protein C5E09_11790 [Rathayibacter iranicus]PPI58256.1 hypothetical protein C5E08_12705 [Rathayibacter iranicus]PPI69371.1 hypothetical protein C5E01_11750 [Rathayibacter iranicus]